MDGDVFVPVPSYKGAQRDYKLASNQFRLNNVIRSCREKQRGETFLVSRQEVTDNVQPVSKLPPMQSDNVEHLQRAVCLLSDEVGELR